MRISSATIIVYTLAVGSFVSAQPREDSIDALVCPTHPDCPAIDSRVLIQVEISQSRIADFATWFSNLTRVAFLVAPEVEPELRVSLSTDTPERLSDIYDRFLSVLSENGLCVVPRGGELVIVRADLLAPTEAVAEPSYSFTADLDGDGAEESTDVFRSRDGRRGFLAIGQSPNQTVSPIYPFWTAIPATLEGSDHSDVLLGVWSHMPRHDEPVPHRALWVVGLGEEQFVERWRGSALARPLIDFRAVDLDDSPGDEVLALEHQYGNCYLTGYQWTGFGFNGLARRIADCESSHFCESPPSGDPAICVGEDRFSARIENGALSLEPERN